MKINKAKKNKKMLRVIVVILTFVLLGTCYYAYQANSESLSWFGSDSSTRANPSTDASESATDLREPSTEQVQAGEDTKSNSVKNSSDDSSPPESGAIKLTATVIVNNGVLRIQTNIDKITNAGTCTLIMTKGDNVKHFPPVGTQALSDYSTCKGFSVNTSSLSSGQWNINIRFKDSLVEGMATITTNIEK